MKKRKDGYLKRSFTFNGKRYYVYGKTSEELNQKETNKRAELKNGRAERENPTIKAYYDYFTDIRRNQVKENSIRTQSKHFKLLAETEIYSGVCFGDLRVKDITRKDIEQTRQILLSKGKTPEHLNIVFSHLNHVFNSALNDEIIERNPCKLLKPLKRTAEPINETKHRALTESETIKFFKTASEQNSIYLNHFKFMINSGLRVGELGALTLSDIDYKTGFIHVNKTISTDELGQSIISDTTKTKSGKRDIPLTPELKKIISEQISFNKSVYGIGINDNIFKSANGKILRNLSINNEIDKICNDAEIESFTCHSFRNTFATRFIEQNPSDYKILSEILGHKDISITLNLYTHVMSENKINSMNKIMIKTS